MTSYNLSSPQWLCFINGIEVPIIAASTTTQGGGLASAQITMPYSPFLSKLPKHTKITLFSLDQAKPNSEPLLEFDGTIQGVSWRQDKVQGNTGLFIMAQTDGLIWAEREKFNFNLDSGFSVDRLMQTTQQFESHDIIGKAAICDPLSYIMKSNQNDAGEVTAVFLTHTFDLKAKLGTIYYHDCGFYFSKTSGTARGNAIANSTDIDSAYYSRHIKKFYEDYQTVRKLCRIPIPLAWKQAFQLNYQWNLLTRQIQPMEGRVNFWNYITYICDMFGFEVYDIPDACVTTVSKSNMTRINGVSDLEEPESILAEYLIKPKSPFGPIPYANVIFPDQVLDKSFYKNYQNEATRAVTVVATFPGISTEATVGLVYSGYSGPYIPDSPNGYFGSFNLKKPGFNVSLSNKVFLEMSPYEQEFGVVAKQIALPEILARLFTTKPAKDAEGNVLSDKAIQKQLTENANTLVNMVNFQYFTAYTEKVSFTLQVTPDVDVVPGMSILVLDENDDHVIAYCYGREKIWDKNGQQVINLKINYPRHYSLQTDFANNYLNTMDPKYYKDTYLQDLAILKQYIGSDSIDQTVPIQTKIIEIMKEWNDIKQNTGLLKNNSKYQRLRTTYKQFLEFYDIENPDAYVDTKLNIMPINLVQGWDISDTAAEMPALQWTYAHNGYLNPQKTNIQNTDSNGDLYGPNYYPSYEELNTPGPIRVSAYSAGIVNCHNRYLMQVGNNIS